MAGICCGVVGEGEATATIEPSARPSRRRSLDMLPLRLMADVAVAVPSWSEASRKRQKLDLSVIPRDCDNARENRDSRAQNEKEEEEGSKVDENENDDVLSGSKGSTISFSGSPPSTEECSGNEEIGECLKFGVTSVCGRRRDMEDSVSVRPSFCHESNKSFHYFGVFDGHGCSHVASMCKERMHEIVKEEIDVAKEELEWKSMMERGFSRMDKEVQSWSDGNNTSSCRCELQTPHCDAVGSTAVVAVVTPEKIIVSNCGDSRAVLCRNGVAIPLSFDHKPDRPDELIRVEAAGGRVIYWDVPRVLGMLAMSRAIGDSYLKPYVISDPEVTVTERSDDDECLILASDGLWDVVSNHTACGVVRMCLKAQSSSPPVTPVEGSDMGAEGSDKACSDASILLTKLALARQTEDNVSVVVIDLRRDKKGYNSTIVKNKNKKNVN